MNYDKESMIVTDKKDGSFTVEGVYEGDPVHRGVVTRDGEVRFSTPTTDPKLPNARRAFEGMGGMEIRGDGSVYVEKPTSVKSNQYGADPRHVLGTLVDHQGRPCYDQRRAIESPSDYRVTIGGTQTTLEAALRLGLVGVGSNGSLFESTENIMQAVNPNDPSLPGADRKQAAPLTFAVQSPEKMLMDTDIQAAGLNPGDIYAKALHDPMRAAREICDNSKRGLHPAEVAKWLGEAIESHIVHVAGAIEHAYGMQPGQGAEVLEYVNRMKSKGTSRSVIGGIMAGDKASVRKAVELYRNRDDY